MPAKITRALTRAIKWVLIILLISTASLSVALRVMLPKLETTALPLQQWMQEMSGFDMTFSSIKSQLRFLTPKVQIENLVLKTKKEGEVLTVKNLDLHMDILVSLINQELVFSYFTIDGLSLDLTKITTENSPESKSITLAERLERLFLVDLKNFSISNSTIKVISPTKEKKVLDIEYLKGKNELALHRMQGIVSVQGTSLNQVEIRMNFFEQGGLSTLDGDFYLNGKDISLITWIAPYLNPQISFDEANISGSAWIEVKKGQMQGARLKLKDALLLWQNRELASTDNGKRQRINVKNSDIYLTRAEDESWQVATNNFTVRAVDKAWSSFAFNLNFLDKQSWQLNLKQLDLALLMPVSQLIELPEKLDNALSGLSPKGQLRDLRLLQEKQQPLAFSGEIEALAFEHWGYLPKVPSATLSFASANNVGKAQLNLENTELPYGKFFQAPLDINKGVVNFFWQYDENNTRIWSDNLKVTTGFLNTKALFLLDIPKAQSPWLSLYAQAQLSDTGQTWRYLPALALSPALTGFLSRSIRAGQTQKSQILWDGKLADFPYQNRQGIFQTSVPIRNAEFSFNTQWPSLKNLDLDLLFENDHLFLSASNVNMLGARGYDLSGKLNFKDGKPMQIDAKIEASGKQLRQYMVATPLVDSVGAALTYINIIGKVKGEIALSIPFDGGKVDVQGFAKLVDNRVETPHAKLDKVFGKVVFVNDKVTAKDMKAELLAQPIDLNIQSETTDGKYVVDINAKGNWQLAQLKKQLVVEPKLFPFTGEAPWRLGIDVALTDIGLQYNINFDADLAKTQSNLPPPFENTRFSKGKLALKAFGDKQDLTGQLVLPHLKYQAQIDLSQKIAQIRKSRTVIGDGELSAHPLLGNVVSLDLPKFDATQWLPIIEAYRKYTEQSSKKIINFLPISRLNAKIGRIKLPFISFNDLSLTMRRKDEDFHFVIDSQELVGDALWQVKQQNVKVNLEQLFVHALPDKLKESKKAKTDQRKASAADRKLIQNFPSLSLKVKELWLQGHRFGQLDTKLKKSRNKLTLSKFILGDKNTQIDVKGVWFIDFRGNNYTNADFSFTGKDSTVLMNRFALDGGVKDASFDTKGKITYQGVPWAIDLKTLSGRSETLLKKGFISGVGGASRILGLFSLDSIIRKLTLDFTGVFDDGMAFDEIRGSVALNKGIAVTNDIEMKALAGDMYIDGKANLVQNTVDANVRFVPDLTSGIPMLTAFAVAPHTAIYVLAVTAVLSPVIDAFTQIQYEVTGNIDDPTVKEVARRRSEVEVSQKLTNDIKRAQ